MASTALRQTLWAVLDRRQIQEEFCEAMGVPGSVERGWRDELYRVMESAQGFANPRLACANMKRIFELDSEMAQVFKDHEGQVDPLGREFAEKRKQELVEALG